MLRLPTFAALALSGGPQTRSSPITKRVYNLGLDGFFAWCAQEPLPGFSTATVAAWRIALEARGLGAVSINVRITAVRKLAVEAADKGLLAPELANGIRREGRGFQERMGNWLTAKQAQAVLNAPDAATNSGAAAGASWIWLASTAGADGRIVDPRNTEDDSSLVVVILSGRTLPKGSGGWKLLNDFPRIW